MTFAAELVGTGRLRRFGVPAATGSFPFVPLGVVRDEAAGTDAALVDGGGGSGVLTSAEATGQRSTPRTGYSDTVEFMTRSCARPGCGEQASATFGYDYAVSTVFLDVLAEEAHPAVYDVCRRHADSLSVPRGWHLVDRRRGPATLAGHLTAP
jgi:hypothetical protein